MMPVGEIRIGEPKQGNGPGRPRAGFRFTSVHPHLLERLKGVYGGSVTPWERRHQLLTNAGAIQAYFSLADLPDGDVESLAQYYEYRDENGKLTRKCDGVTCRTWQGGQRVSVPCLCAERGDDLCKVRSYVSVILPSCADIGVWTLRTGSQNFASEVLGLIATAKTMMPGVNLIPVILTITRRHKETAPGQKAGFYPVVTVSLDPNPVPLSVLRDQVIASMGMSAVPTALPGDAGASALPPVAGSEVAEQVAAEPVAGDVVEGELVADSHDDVQPLTWLEERVGAKLAQVADARFGPGLAAFVDACRSQGVDSEALRLLITSEEVGQ